MDSQMKKGILEMCLLYVIAKEDVYGYQLLKTVSDIFPDVNESTVYSILRRLYSGGYTKTYKVAVQNAPERKYYKITTEGKEYLAASVDSFKEIVRVITILGIV